MDASWTIGIICVGIIVVVGGILALRLHAFLALTFGALTVALLTPRTATENYLVGKDAVEVNRVQDADGRFTFQLQGKLKAVKKKLTLGDGDAYVIVGWGQAGDPYAKLAYLTEVRLLPEDKDASQTTIQGKVTIPIPAFAAKKTHQKIVEA